eukprot:5249331-Pleurochrysis_carterae.AAC.1
MWKPPARGAHSWITLGKILDEATAFGATQLQAYVCKRHRLLSRFCHLSAAHARGAALAQVPEDERRASDK